MEIIKLDGNKRVPFQSILVDNHNLSFTWDSIIGHIKNHLFNFTKETLNIDLKEIEQISADPAYQRIYNAGKQLIDRNVLPRGVLLENYSAQKEPLANVVPEFKSTYYNSVLQYKIFEFQQKSKKIDYSNEPYNWVCDHNFSVVASIRHATSEFHYTILVNTKPESIDIAKQMRYYFAPEDIKPLYAKEVYDINEYKYRIIPYNARCELPRDLINKLKSIFKIETDEDMLIHLRRFSDLEVNYTVDGAQRERIFTIDYPVDITIKVDDVDDGIVNSDNNTKYYGVKLSATIYYIELPIFKIVPSSSEINYCCPAWQIEDHCPQWEVPHNQFSVDLNGLKQYESYRIEYTEDDVQYIKDVDGYDTSDYYIITSLENLTGDGILNEYIHYILTSPTILDPSRYINFEVKRLTLAANDGYDPVIGTDPEIHIDIDMGYLLDHKSKVGDQVDIMIFLNKEHYLKWRKLQGYDTQQNLTDII